jgi:etoposide-induced 2.4 mRNA
MLELIKNKILDFFTGIADSLQIFNIYDIVSHPKISNNIINCILLNGFLFIGSIMLYSIIIEPIISYILKITTFGYFLYVGVYFYYIVWLIPIYLVCNVVTSFKIDEIYFDSIELIDNNKNEKIAVDGITAISNQLTRLLIVICFIIYINILNFIPYLGFMKYVIMCILNSLYVFEYILLQKYIRDYKSIMIFIENKFFYFLGYGMLLTLMINTIDSVTINSAIFLMAFPFFLIASIKINNKRFGNIEIRQRRLEFLYPIGKLYDAGIYMLSYILRRK